MSEHGHGRKNALVYMGVFRPQARAKHHPRKASNSMKNPPSARAVPAARLSLLSQAAPRAAKPQSPRAMRPGVPIFGAKSFMREETSR